MKLRTALVHLVATTAIVLASLVATATLGFAQAYCPCNGTGNVIDTPLLEKTNGAYGWAMSVPPQGGAAAAAGSSSRRMKHKGRR